MRPVLLAAVALSLAAGACRAQPPSTMPPAESAGAEGRSVPLTLGETRMALVVHDGAGESAVRYLIVHDDENTAVAAGTEAVRQRGGRLVELQAQGERYVTFRMSGRAWSFDPNRVFTQAGARLTLDARNGGRVPDAVVQAVRRFADGLVEAYGTPPVIVTLHNNTEGNYSAASYLPGGSDAAEAALVSMPDGADPDDFFFTTDRALYDRLVPSGFAVILQNNAGATDDGSLSVWAAQHGRAYVNVEAQHGHEAQQRRMLEVLEAALEDG